MLLRRLYGCGLVNTALLFCRNWIVFASTSMEDPLANHASSLRKQHKSCMRLTQIEGRQDMRNDVIVYENPKPTSHVIYFGGDVQDYLENMVVHRDNHRYRDWNLEDTAAILGKRFPSSTIWVIRPSRMHLRTFSVFANFVESNDFGVPTHSENYGAWRQIQGLFYNALRAHEQRKYTQDDSDNSADVYHQMVSNIPQSEQDQPIYLVGFSKGCVVLNQLVNELKFAKQSDALQGFLRNVRQWYWLDGGHSGGSDTWVTRDHILRELCDMNYEIFVCVTPYQVRDKMRKWIRKEKDTFVEKLKKLGIQVHDKLHFQYETRSIENHFRILLVF